MRGNRQPDYSEQEVIRLIRYNEYVQVYLLGPLLALLLGATAINFIGKYLSYLRRGTAARFIGKERPSAACSRTGVGCTRWIPSTVLAILRKLGCRKSRIAGYFGMSAWGETAVIALYWIANLILVVCGGKLVFLLHSKQEPPIDYSSTASGSIDFMAHHAARLALANLPLMIGLASKYLPACLFRNATVSLTIMLLAEIILSHGR